MTYALPSRIYIAGPMTGYPELNFPAFHQAAQDLRGFGFEVVSPAEVKLPCGCSGGSGCGPVEHGWQDYMRADLAAMLLGADAVALLRGYEKSKGARLEMHVAQALGMPTLLVDGWLAEAQVQGRRAG